MSKDEIEGALSLLDTPGSYPAIIHYGDTLWKKNVFKCDLLDLPGGRVYSPTDDLTPPKTKGKWGSRITRDRFGTVYPGIGIVAANLTEVEGDQIENIQLIFHAEPNAAGIAIVNERDEIISWIDREDATSL